MQTTNKMTCPHCGTEMNHHAEKIDYSLPPDESNEIDRAFGGQLEEIYSCPGCGSTEARRSE